MDRKDYEEKQLKQQSRLRSIYDFSMGILWLAAGIFFLVYRKLGIEINFDPQLSTLFGGACILYGLFRIWRGYKIKRAG